jgi:hypothetical protein
VLPPDTRAILRDLLKPPIGSRLIHAVGTSFSVDFAAALAVPLSFAARDLGDTPDPIGAMEAVRSSVDRIDVFYQAGQAAVPQQPSDILAFLEPVLHPVKARRPGRLFHPKVWVLKNIDSNGDVTYRLVCSTRNLTNDRCWDAVISIDGKAGPKLEPGNEPLSRLLRSLPGLCTGVLDSRRRERVNSLADDVRQVVWELPEEASSMYFHSLGLGRASSALNFSAYRRLVVSPFLDPMGLEIVAPDARSATIVVSRPEQLDRLYPGPVVKGIRILDAGAELQDERAAGELTGLHAKLILVERDRRAHLFLGSANATKAAYDGNVEFLVEIVRGALKYGVEAHLSNETGFGALLVDYAPRPPMVDLEEEKRFELQNLLRNLAAMSWTMVVETNSDRFDLQLRTSANLPATSARLTVEAITRRGEAIILTPGQRAHGAFVRVPLADITAFLVLTAEADNLRETTVIPAELIGDPEDRLDAVLARQVDTPEKFMRFLLLILGLAGAEAEGDERVAGAGSWWTSGSTSVFELLARSLADNPGGLDDLDRLVDRLTRTDAGRAVMPDGFAELGRTVVEARQLVEAQS